MGKQRLSTATQNRRWAEQSSETQNFCCANTNQQEKELAKSISVICAATVGNTKHGARAYFAVISVAYKMQCTFASMSNTAAFLKKF